MATEGSLGQPLLQEDGGMYGGGYGQYESEHKGASYGAEYGARSGGMHRGGGPADQYADGQMYPQRDQVGADGRGSAGLAFQAGVVGGPEGGFMAAPDGDEEDDDGTPTILFLGARGSGKSSIVQVVFHKLSPHETMFLEQSAAADAQLVDHNALHAYEVWDLPGDARLDAPVPFDHEEEMEVDPAGLLQRAGAVVLVVDAQHAASQEWAQYCRMVCQTVATNRPDLTLDVMVHKLDGDMFQRADQRMDQQGVVQTVVQQAMADAGVPDPVVAFHQTSVYNHSVFEAVSLIVQRTVRPLATVEGLLDTLVQNCMLEKATLFDVSTKLQLATDPAPAAEGLAELSADLLDTVVDIGLIYGKDPSKGPSSGLDPVAGGGAGVLEGEEEDEEEEDDDGAFDRLTSATVRLREGRTVSIWEVGPQMALVAISSDLSATKRKGLIDCNVESFRLALHRAFEPPSEARARGEADGAQGRGMGAAGGAGQGVPFPPGSAGSAAGFSDRDSAVTGPRGMGAGGRAGRGASRGGSLAISPADALGALPLASMPRDSPGRGVGAVGRGGTGRAVDVSGGGMAEGSYEASPASYQHVGSLRKVVAFGPSGGGADPGGVQSYVGSGTGLGGSIQQ